MSDTSTEVTAPASAAAPASTGAAMPAAAPDVLATIVAATRRTVELRREAKPASVLEAEARQANTRPNGAAFLAGLSRTDRFNVIAECKRRSPSKGVLRADYDPVAIASAYASAGAAAISVLTEPSFFDGSLDHLSAVRRAVTVPILRKDFVVDDYQVLEAVAAGADAVLLIVAALDDKTLRHLLREAENAGLAALVETHTREEMIRAIDAGARIIGVNSRSLRSLQVSLDTLFGLAELLTPATIGVAESGIRTRADLDALRAAGYKAFLVGERLMTDADPGAALTRLMTGEGSVVSNEGGVASNERGSQ
jgi:indole-3-glycerol phosphate synthase